jgi:biopolymer transport protein TolQ
VAQHAALACFEPESLAEYEKRRAEFKARRDYFIPELQRLGFEVPVVPDGAFYAYADARKAVAKLGLHPGRADGTGGSWDLAFELMQRARVVRSRQAAILARPSRSATCAFPRPAPCHSCTKLRRSPLCSGAWRPSLAEFSWPVRIYWEDTDAGGIVFYANYLKFFERARTEWLRSLGVAQHALRERTGGMFVVSETRTRHLAPARLDDHELQGHGRAGAHGPRRAGAASTIFQLELSTRSCARRQYVWPGWRLTSLQAPSRIPATLLHRLAATDDHKAMNQQDLSIVQLLLHASWVVQAVVMASAGHVGGQLGGHLPQSCCLRLMKVARLNEAFDREFWSGTSAQRSCMPRQRKTHVPAAPWSAFLPAACASTRSCASAAFTDSGALLDGARRAMRASYQREMDAVESPICRSWRTTGSVSPYVGLFGTVWGIMHAFTGLASLEQVTLATVAPGIAEALVATAIGLFAAIPAVIAYNRFARDIDRVANRLETFIEEFSNILQRNLGAQAH